jgi:hypothetical protein
MTPVAGRRPRLGAGPTPNSYSPRAPDPGENKGAAESLSSAQGCPEGELPPPVAVIWPSVAVKP